MTDPQVAIFMLSLFIFLVLLGFPIAFTLIGGVFAIRTGIFRALIISGIAMATTNLFFSLMAWIERSELVFVLAVLLDDLATAFATVTFVAFISTLIDRNYTATQYALLASIGTAGRTLLASSSGVGILVGTTLRLDSPAVYTLDSTPKFFKKSS